LGLGGATGVEDEGGIGNDAPLDPEPGDPPPDIGLLKNWVNSPPPPDGALGGDAAGDCPGDWNICVNSPPGPEAWCGKGGGGGGSTGFGGGGELLCGVWNIRVVSPSCALTKPLFFCGGLGTPGGGAAFENICVNSPPEEPAAGGFGAAPGGGVDWNMRVNSPPLCVGGGGTAATRAGGFDTGRWLVGMSSNSLLNSMVSDPARPAVDEDNPGGGAFTPDFGSSNSLLNSTVN